MKKILLDTTDSTNSYIKREIETIQPLTMVLAKDQTAGRGQRGNSWEAEPGRNLTLSFFIIPSDIRPAQQFIISEAVALAILDTLSSYGIVALVKWPNDIYVADKKICGILIENSIMGVSISHSIIGIGLNVNQTVFVSDAPNPVSMAQIAGKEFSLDDVADRLGGYCEARLDETKRPDELHKEYFARLWRSDGSLHPFREPASGERFFASIHSVELTGHLNLKRSNGEIRCYAFKEVEFILS